MAHPIHMLFYNEQIIIYVRNLVSTFSYFLSIELIKHFSCANNSRLLSQLGFFPSQGISNGNYVQIIENKNFDFIQVL